MKYFYKLLFFCVFVILPANNGKPIAGCPRSQDGVCDSCVAHHLNTQIEEKLNKYPEVPFPKLELTETFNKLRNDLASALITESSSDDACTKAELALENFEQFMLQYDSTKAILESLIKKLLKKEAKSKLSEGDAFEAFRLSLVLEDSATIDDAMSAIRIARTFLNRTTGSSKGDAVTDSNKNDNNEKNNGKDDKISDKETAALEDLLKNVANSLSKLLQNKPSVRTANENTSRMSMLTTVADNLVNLLQGPRPNRELIRTVIVSLINVITKQSLFDEKPIVNEETTSLEDLIKILETNIIIMINKKSTKPILEPGDTAANAPVPPDVVAYINKKINQRLERYPKQEDGDLKLQDVFNENRMHLEEALLQTPTTEEAVDKAENALKEFDLFAGQYNNILNALDKLITVEQNEDMPPASKYHALKCIHELEKCTSMGDALNIYQKCKQYYDA